MERQNQRESGCPVVAFDRADEGYAEQVVEWIANPHAYFKSFGPEAREFQRRHRSERLRTMTLVAPAAELSVKRPVRLSVDRSAVSVGSWEEVFSQSLSRLAVANAPTFEALQAAGELGWLGCPADGEPFGEVLASGGLQPEFANLDEVICRVQWLFLMCGIRLNEVIVQVDPYTDEEWTVRHEEILSRRAADKAFMEGRKAAQKAWAESHPEETEPTRVNPGWL